MSDFMEWEQINFYEFRSKTGSWAVIQAHDSDNGSRLRREGKWNVYRAEKDHPINFSWEARDTPDAAKSLAESLAAVLSTPAELPVPVEVIEGLKEWREEMADRDSDRLKPSLDEQLELEAKALNITFSSLVRSILVRHVERRGVIKESDTL